MLTGKFAPGGDPRAAGSFDNPNALAFFLVVALPGVLLAFEKRAVARPIAWLAFLSAVAGVVCTVSRKGFISLVLCLVIYLVLQKYYKSASVCLIAALVGFTVLYSQASFFQRRFSDDAIERDLVGRSAMVWTGLLMFKDRPLLGFGYDGYYENLPKYVRHWKKYSAHNMYITTLVDNGFFGFVLFMLIFLYPIRVCTMILRSRGFEATPFSRHLATVCLATVLPYMVSIYFSGGSFSNYFVIGLIFTHISFTLSAYREELKQKRSSHNE
jgi:O-antigen ligase